MDELKPCPFCGGKAPTNDERREVAARLRKCIAGKTPDAEVSVEMLYSAIGMPIYYRIDSDFVERLAYLIEPAPERTCRGFGGLEGTNGEGYDFACDACGYCCDLPDPNYCPNCGTKVVE